MVSGFVINGGENCHESRQPTLIPKETVQQLCALLVLHKQDELTGIAKDEQHLFFAQRVKPFKNVTRGKHVAPSKM